MRKFSIPYTKDNQLLNLMGDERRYIKEIFIPLPYDILPSGRPYNSDEVAKYSEIFESEVKRIKDMNIDVAVIATKVIIDYNNGVQQISKAANKIEYLKDAYNIDKVVIGNTTFLKMYGERLKSRGIKIEMSTMVDIDTVEKIDQMMILFPWIDSVCLNNTFLYNKSDIEYIKKTYPNLGIKLLVNHGCLVNCISHITHHHYLSSMLTTESDGSAESWRLASNARQINAAAKTCTQCTVAKEPNFVRDSAFIRPEDIQYYNDVVDIFKISGREHATPNILRMVKAFGEQKYDGNLCDIMDMPYFTPYGIDNTKFPEEFAEKRLNCEHKCHKCGYCNLVLKQVAITSTQQG